MSGESNDAEAMGRRYGLGPYESTHFDAGVSSSRRFSRGMVVAALVLLPLVVLPGILSKDGIGFSVGLGLLVFGVGVVGVIGLRAVPGTSRPLHIYADGFILSADDRPEPQVMRWADVVELDATIVRPEDVDTHVRSCTLLDRHGRQVTVVGTAVAYPSDQVRVIAEKAEPVVTPSVVGAMVRAFDTGESLTFGTVSIDRDGITDHRKAEPLFLAWRDLRSVTIDGRILLSAVKTGEHRSHSINVGAAPNAYFVYHIVERAAGRARIDLRHVGEAALPPRVSGPTDRHR